MQPLGWNIDPKDWEQPGADAIVAAVQRQLQLQAPDGGIILMHDGGGDRDETVAALEQLIPWLVAHGYRVRLPRPLSHGLLAHQQLAARLVEVHRPPRSRPRTARWRPLA